MSKDKHFAVVVAIDLYPGFADRNLKGPVNDARAFIRWLEDPAGGDLPAKNVRCLLSEPSQDDPARPAPGDAHPKAREVDALFRPFYKQGQDARIGERLYIFASGHGVSDPIDLHSAALLTANASPTKYWHISLVERAEWFRRYAVFDEIVLFSDCCRDNIGFELTSPCWREPRLKGPAHPRASIVRYLYGFAVGYGKQSREREFEDGQTHGIFSKTLLKALKEAPPDATGRVTGQRLQDYVHNIHQSVAANVDTGPPDFDASELGDIVFSEVSETTAHVVKVQIQPHTGHETLVVTQNLDFIERFQSVASTQSLRLAPGLYKLEIAGTDRHRLIEVPQDHECVL